jgi:hypothetical protein
MYPAYAKKVRYVSKKWAKVVPTAPERCNRAPGWDSGGDQEGAYETMSAPEKRSKAL